MKKIWILILSLLLTGSSLADKKNDPFRLGKLSLGQKSARVQRILGQPTSKGEVQEEMATGEMVQRWSYPNLGLELDLSQSEGSSGFTLYRVYATEPCKLSGYRGINIGTFAVEARAVARSMKGRKGVQVTQSEQGCSFLWEDAYQMLHLTFKKGKVSELFLGPGPE